MLTSSILSTSRPFACPNVWPSPPEPIFPLVDLIPLDGSKDNDKSAIEQGCKVKMVFLTNYNKRANENETIYNKIAANGKLLEQPLTELKEQNSWASLPAGFFKIRGKYYRCMKVGGVLALYHNTNSREVCRWKVEGEY